MKKITSFALLTAATSVAIANHHPQIIEEATIASIHHAIKNHQITCEQLVNQYIERIKSYNLSAATHAPINAFTVINTNAIDQARKLDADYAKTKTLTGSLHCIPFVLKDNIDSYDAISSAGTLALLGNQPNQDAFLVTKLREAGAIILGKNGMDELAAGMFGVSSRSGRIGNAYDADKNPGGSSGGSAAAVSANFTMIGIGTDNSGSVRIPAAFNGIYGLRPSTGLISQRGIFPAGNVDGTAGPLARTVEDLARTLDVIAKEDTHDAKTANIKRPTTYTAYLNKNGLQGKRIGIVRNIGGVSTYEAMPENISALFKQSLQALQRSGAIIIDNIALSQFNNNRDANMAGMRQDINDYLASFPAVRKDYQDLCESNRTRVYGDIDKCLDFFKSMPIRFGKEHKNALDIFNKNKTYVETIMNNEHLDALLIPISRMGVATYDAKEVNTWQAPVSSNAGLPAIAINFGYVDNMPVGVELIGKQFAEGSLIEMAYAYEKNSRPRKTPVMPEKNNTFEKFDLPAYNNLLANIGYQSYYDILMAHKSNQAWQDLTPTVFKNIVNHISRSLRV